MTSADDVERPDTSPEGLHAVCEELDAAYSTNLERYAAALLRTLVKERDEALALNHAQMQELRIRDAHDKDARSKALDEAAAAIDNVDPELAELILSLKDTQT